MTIEESLEWLISRKEHYEMDDSCQELAQALDVSIEIMRKYQKIREIAFPLQFCTTDKLNHEAIMKICEVLEDGNDI